MLIEKAACFLLACWVAVGAAGEVNADQPARTTGRWADVSRWMIEAESQVVFVDGVVLSADGAKNARIVHRIVAASSKNELYFFSGHEEEQIRSDWRNEPFNIEIWLQNEKLTKYRKFNRQVQFAKLPVGKEVPPPIASDVLLLFLPVWPLPNYPAPRNKSPSMSFVVKAALDSGTYKAVLERQLIDGQLCNEICSPDGNDKIWLAQDKDLCLMRRQWFDPKTRKMIGEIITRHVAEVAPGLWMPVEIEAVNYSSTGIEKNPTPKSSIITRVTSWKFGADVPTEIFQPRLEPGSIELIEPGTFRQLSSGGMEHLDQVAAFYRGPIGLPQQPPVAGRLIYGIALVAAGGLVGMILFRLRRKSLPMTEPKESCKL